MRLREDNRGAALVTVLIVVTFLSILVTTLLYVAGMNYKTKQVEYQNKMSFYTCETALEEIKAVLIMDASKACKTAYKETMLQYANLDAGERKNLYEQKFVDAMEALWIARYDTDDVKTLKDRCGLTANSSGCVSSTSGWNYSSVSGACYAELKDVVVGYTSPTGYTTMLKTDFRIEAPDINWSNDSSAAFTPGSNTDQRVLIDIEDYVVYNNWSKY